MTIEVDQRRGSENRVRVVDRKKAMRKKKCMEAARRPAGPGTLQMLFRLCRDVFHGPGSVPRPQDVQTLSRVLDAMKPEDVGLSSDMQFLGLNESCSVLSTTIYSCDQFSLCLFFLPATGVIPLHNHPGMTVFSKLLLGTMHVKAYDWADSDDSDERSRSSQWRLARLKANKVLAAPCDASVLYPTSGGNIHAFTAITPCVVLDVIGPPYSKADGRDCTYYQDIPCADFSNGDCAAAAEKGECYGWLEEIEMPVGSKMEAIEYLGPPIVETAC